MRKIFFALVSFLFLLIIVTCSNSHQFSGEDDGVRGANPTLRCVDFLRKINILLQG